MQRKYTTPLLITALIALGCQDPVLVRIKHDKPSGNKGATQQQLSSARWLDSLGERILPLFEEHETVFAPGFQEQKFKSMPIGINQREALLLLGKPLLRKSFEDGSVCWYYSKPGKKSVSYFVRVLEFDRSGALAEKHALFSLSD